MIRAADALARLRAGNERFVSAMRRHEPFAEAARRRELVPGQNPFAVILGCSDSRVPVEIVFDQGLGDLFVIRVAGNIVAPSQIGSVEFAAQRFGSRLVVVLGHTGCGAVLATIEELARPRGATEHIGSILDAIRPAVEGVLRRHAGEGAEVEAREAVRANVRASVTALRHGSELIERQIRERGLLVVGAEYSLESGAVEFFDREE